MIKASALIVDDKEEVRSLLAELLDDSGQFRSVIQAEDGLMALKRLSNQSFDIILLDINMPKMNGVEVARHISENKLSPKGQVVIISGELDKELLQQAMALGVKHFIVKPFTNDQFIEKVEEVLQKKAA